MRQNLQMMKAENTHVLLLYYIVLKLVGNSSLFDLLTAENRDQETFQYQNKITYKCILNI